MSILTHDDLGQIGKHFGYTNMVGGLCKGFNGSLAQAIIAGDKEAYWKRLKLIEPYKNNIPSLVKKVEDIQAREKKKEQLTDEDIALLQILSYYSVMKLYLSPWDHQGIFGSYIPETALKEIFAIAKSTKQDLEKREISIVSNKPHAFERAGLINYIAELGKVVKNHERIPIFLDSFNHSVLLEYNPKNPDKPWIYVDTNDFARYRENPDYYRELTNEELCDSLFISLSHPSKPIVFNTTIVADSENPINKDSAIQEFESKYQADCTSSTLYDSDGVGLLFIACQFGHMDVVEHLLKEEKSIKINQPNKNGITPFYMACQNGHTKIVERLLKEKSIEIGDVNAMCSGLAPLSVAAKHGHVQIVKLLVDAGVDFQGIYKNTTPLWEAAQQGHAEVVKLLLDAGADFNETCNNATPLWIAAKNGHYEVVQRLLDAGAPMNAKCFDMTPLWIAAQNGHVEVVKRLLAAGADPDGIYDNPRPLWIAAQNGHAEVVKLLLTAGASMNVNCLNMTPLWVAAKNGDVEVVKLLLTPDVDVDGLCNNATPLWIAAQEGKDKVIDSLLTAGANVNAKCLNKTPLGIALEQGHLKVAERLLQHPNILLDEESNDISPLYFAAHVGYVDIVNLLLNRGALVDKPIVMSAECLLNYANIRGKALSLIQELVIKNNEGIPRSLPGFTPLHAAIFFGHEAIVKRLLDSKADLNKTVGGLSCLDLANIMGNQAIITMVENMEKAAFVKASVVEGSQVNFFLTHPKSNNSTSQPDHPDPDHPESFTSTNNAVIIK